VGRYDDLNAVFSLSGMPPKARQRGRRRSTVDQPPSERSAAADASKSTIAAIRPWRQRFPGSPRASERW